MLAKTCGIRKLFVLVNKMDDSTVEWDQARYDDIIKRVTPYLKGCGYTKKELDFLPASGYTGENLVRPISDPRGAWYSGHTLIQHLDEVPLPPREEDKPVVVAISERYSDMGVVLLGKVERGVLETGATVLLQPHNLPVEVTEINVEGKVIAQAHTGFNVRIRIRVDIDDESTIQPGSVLVHPDHPLEVTNHFTAQLIVLEHRSIITAGWSGILHLTSTMEECQITSIIASLNKAGKVDEKLPKFVKPGSRCVCRMSTTAALPITAMKDFARFGRFAIRDEGRTVAVGIVVRTLPPVGADQ
eukprot:gnl/Ergobibamus_cyprinoides/405.p1 GENE.gnl/Ergobibamus_cyprinoides/405~~gnl/Ergobibamus_cyprinoides/405.p1  ORF type:complete len:301 (+),score=115.09 gnl/Ergobibamus_cyprinoides/405:91-993(+)